MQDDGSLIYINNRVVARLEDGETKSFFFDSFELNSATVDNYGNIWLWSITDGLFRLDADCFDAYQVSE